jgi:hypothetical protein
MIGRAVMTGLMLPLSGGLFYPLPKLLSVIADLRCSA